MKYFSSKGLSVPLGRELGRGGEGAVFEVPSDQGLVAKVYHKAPNPRKQAKLSFMASTADQKLLSYVAWPKATLHERRGGPVIGFLMPNIGGKEAIHAVYSPAHRRQSHPNAAWNYLVYVSRNIAASFATIHAHGHVVGDVNQNSFMVGRDSKVTLIDSDSFQINAAGTLHLCEVGVPHFTPPELQSLPTFKGLTRTSNHDNFGLALLIFHVLLGGRHPFSGVPLRHDVGNELEKSIRDLRYAYARDGSKRGMVPPPRSIPVSILPASIEPLFHLAFTEQGAAGARPTAAQWVAALDGLRATLTKCGASGMHIYPNHLHACPWCALERQGVRYFTAPAAMAVPGATQRSPSAATPASGFMLHEVWERIQAISPPPGITIPSPSQFQATGCPLPPHAAKSNVSLPLQVIVVLLALGLQAALPEYWWLTWPLAGIGLASIISRQSSARKAEVAIRTDAVKVAEGHYKMLVAAAKKDNGVHRFQSCMRALAQAKQRLESLPSEERNEGAEWIKAAYLRRQREFLDTCFVDDADIPGIGPSRKATLVSFGIESAADVAADAVRQLPGFGEALTSAMMYWRKECENKFVFDPKQALSTDDLKALKAKFGAIRHSLENTLAQGPQELQMLRQQALQHASVMLPAIEAPARQLAQAQADWKML